MKDRDISMLSEQMTEARFVISHIHSMLRCIGSVVKVRVGRTSSWCQAAYDETMPLLCKVAAVELVVFSFVSTFLAHQHRGPAGAPCSTVRVYLAYVYPFKARRKM